MKFTSIKGATPLDPEEIKELIPPDIASQAELNAVEERNIIQARQWGFKRKQNVLTETFLRELHHKMFNEVWSWAGRYRKTDKNIGVHWTQIPQEISKLLSDVKFWIANRTFSWDEIGSRYHHRLVLIHPFVNGNGRHARLATDLLFLKNGQELFTWGARTLGSSLYSKSKAREAYLEALRLADDRKYEKLIQFVRS